VSKTNVLENAVFPALGSVREIAVNWWYMFCKKCSKFQGVIIWI